MRLNACLIFNGLHIGACPATVDERAVMPSLRRNKHEGADLGGLPPFQAAIGILILLGLLRPSITAVS